jgi:malonyl-CoA/methylmalonyl-CoA synthetase
MDILTPLYKGATRPKQVFLQDAAEPVTYAMACDRAGIYAHALVRCGVRKGDRVAVKVSKSAEALFLYLGCLRLGAIFLPLNPAYTSTETDYFLKDAETALFVCDDADQTTLMPGSTTVTLRPDNASSLLSPTDLQSRPFVDRDHAPDDIAAILYTSGTTGRPKGVMLTRNNLSSNAETLAGVWAFGPTDVLLHALPIFHTHGLLVATNTVLMAGASMVFLPDFSPDQVIKAIPSTTVMMGVPTYYARLLGDARLDRTLTAHMRLFISGSAPLPAAAHRDWQDRTGHAIIERYGMTETNMNTSNPYHGDRRAGTVGQALPHVEIRITDPATGLTLPTGQVGGVEVRGPNVFKGYWRQPDKTAEDIRPDGFFKTGDMGVLDDDGYLRLVGRSKDLIITGGLNVYPAEVEDVLDDLPGIAASAVIGVPHPDFGEAVVAVVTPRPGAELDENVLRTVLRARLAPYKLPKRILSVAQLPRNSMGKIQKTVLRSTWGDLFNAGG